MSDRLTAVAAQMADTLRGVLAVVDRPEPYPWQGGALKQQIREDLTAFEALGLDAVPAPPATDQEREGTG